MDNTTLRWVATNSFGKQIKYLKMIINNPLKTYKVHIGGCSLQLKSRQDVTTFKKAMHIVDQHMQSSQKQYRALSMQKQMVLSCLNIAGELVYLKKALSQKLNRLESVTKNVVSQLKSSSSNITGKK